MIRRIILNTDISDSRSAVIISFAQRQNGAVMPISHRRRGQDKTVLSCSRLRCEPGIIVVVFRPMHARNLRVRLLRRAGAALYYNFVTHAFTVVFPALHVIQNYDHEVKILDECMRRHSWFVV